LRPAAALALALSLACGAAAGSSDPFAGLVPSGGAAIGPIWGAEQSPYRGGGVRHDFLPLYIYEGPRVFLRSHSIGLRFEPLPAVEGALFLRRRFEGHPTDSVPRALEGMARRELGVDVGLGAHTGFAGGVAFAELLRDGTAASRGTEGRLGYRYPWRSGRFLIWPQVVLALRNARLNDYYYGVLEEEAAAERPAYRAGAGITPEVGLYASYRLTDRWRILTGATVERLPNTVAASPIVEQRTQTRLLLGAFYDVSPPQDAWADERPLIVRAYHGASTDCRVVEIVTLRCTATHTGDSTSVSALEIGRPLVERLNGWPLDLAGFVGLLRHHETGLQPDFWQINGYLKAYFYGFPWDARLRTRLGWGVGLSYARRIPFTEVRDHAGRGRPTSRLLNTFDPTADVSAGDLLGVRGLRETFIGVGVSHRSGIFGTARHLGNVRGGSNYIYGYVETTF
jgi:MipA family protein